MRIFLLLFYYYYFYFCMNEQLSISTYIDMLEQRVLWGEPKYGFCPLLLFGRREVLSALVFKGRKYQDYLVWPGAICLRSCLWQRRERNFGNAKSQPSKLQSGLFVLLSVLFSTNIPKVILRNQNTFIS